MENSLEQFVKKLVESMGFDDYKVEVDEEHNHGSIFIHNDPALIKEHLPTLVESANHLLQLVTRKSGGAPFFLDINNYRKERENLIIELVRATTRKVVVTRQELPLPAMNSYERRLVHMELAAHPHVTTESVGKGHGRYVIIRPVQEGQETSTGTVVVEVPESAGKEQPTRFEDIISGIGELQG